MLLLKIKNLLRDADGPLSPPVRLSTSTSPKPFPLRHEETVELGPFSNSQLPDLTLKLHLQSGPNKATVEIRVTWQLLKGKHIFHLHPSSMDAWIELQPGVFDHRAGAGFLALKEGPDGILIVGTLDMDFASRHNAA
jgi:hypothetical protein